MNEDSLRYQGWRVVAASGVGVFFACVTVFTFAVLLRPIAHEFSWSRESVSAAYGLMTLAVAFSAPAMGYVVDRWGPRGVVGPSLAIAGSAFASLTMLTAHVWHLYAVFVLIGLASAGTSPVVYARVVSSWFDKRRGAALAAMIACIGVGAIVHPPAFQSLVRVGGWRNACFVLGIVMVLVGVPAVVRFVREPGPAGSVAAARVAGQTTNEALRTRTFWTLMGIVFGTTLALNATLVHMSALLSDRGIPVEKTVIAMSAMGAASLLGRLLTGWLLDTFDAIRVSVALLACAAAGTLLLASATSVPAGIAAAVLIGFGTGGEVDVTPYLLSRYFGVRSMSTLYGIMWTAFGLAGAAGPILMGRAFDATGSYENVLTVFAAGTLAAAGLTLTLPAYRRSGAGAVSAV